MKISSCDSIPDGNYFLSPKTGCSPGTWETAGKSFDYSPCLKSNATHFVKTKCSLDSPSVLAECTTLCGEDEFYISTCSADADAKCSKCSRPSDGQFVSSVCFRGSIIYCFRCNFLKTKLLSNMLNLY